MVIPLSSHDGGTSATKAQNKIRATIPDATRTTKEARAQPDTAHHTTANQENSSGRQAEARRTQRTQTRAQRTARRASTKRETTSTAPATDATTSATARNRESNDRKRDIDTTNTPKQSTPAEARTDEEQDPRSRSPAPQGSRTQSRGLTEDEPQQNRTAATE